jgi:hypothetical protein
MMTPTAAPSTCGQGLAANAAPNLAVKRDLAALLVERAADRDAIE